MQRSVSSTAIISTVIMFIASVSFACEPGGGNHSKYGGFGDKGIGSFVPGPVAQMPAAPNPAAFAAYAQHRQMLVAQAAAYRAARRPMKLAKAYQLRQDKLAARESRRAWVLAKQEEWKRSQQQDATKPTNNSHGPVLLAMSAKR